MYFQPILLTINRNGNPEEEFAFYLDNNKLTVKQENIYKVFTDKSSLGINQLLKLNREVHRINDSLNIFLVEKAEKMTEEAQNSLLKTLEEPNENTLIILMTSNSGLILETIRSRCIEVNQINSSNVIDNYEFQKFIDLNYIQRRKMIDEIVKKDNPREFAIDLILYIMEYAKRSKPSIGDQLISIYQSVRIGSNTKLALENLSLLLI